MTEDLYNDQWISIDGNHIHKTAIIHPNVKMGKGNWIGAYTVIGSNGEMRVPKDFKGTLDDFQRSFKGFVNIGDSNVISELVTIQRPYLQTATSIGSGNIIMAHSHIGHDVFIGNNCEICTGTIIGGYTIIKDEVKIKLGVTLRNRLTIERGVTIGLSSAVTKDLPEGVIAYGNPAKIKV